MAHGPNDEIRPISLLPKVFILILRSFDIMLYPAKFKILKKKHSFACAFEKILN